MLVENLDEVRSYLNQAIEQAKLDKLPEIALDNAITFLRAQFRLLPTNGLKIIPFFEQTNNHSILVNFTCNEYEMLISFSSNPVPIMFIGLNLLDGSKIEGKFTNTNHPIILWPILPKSSNNFSD